MAALRLFIFLITIAGLAAGCVQPGMAAHNPGNVLPGRLTGTAWLAQELVAQSTSPVPAPQLHFSSPTQVRGHGGCNAFGADLAVTGVEVRLGPVASTRKFCGEPAMRVEAQFFQALGRVNALRLDRDTTLVLLDDKGVVVLRLARQP